MVLWFKPIMMVPTIRIKNVFIGVLILAAVALTAVFGYNHIGQETTNIGSAGNFPDAQWFVVDKFSGFQTKIDPVKIAAGANPNGQNTTVNNGDRVSVREYGTTILGTVTTTEKSVNSLHTFRRRDGENILMRTYADRIEWFDEGNNSWETLKITTSTGLRYGFADYNINTDLRSYVYFGNGDDVFRRWTGQHTLLNGAISAGAGTITVDDTTGFDTAGNAILCDTQIAYTGRTGTTFTGVVNAPACANNTGITQAVEDFPANPKGNIYLVANNRIFIAGVTTTPQAVYFSQYGEARTYLTTLISTSTATAPGIFNLGEGGGAVTGAVQDESAIYFFKKSIIYKATLSDSLYTLAALKPFDGRSQTTGAVQSDSVFATDNGFIFLTPDNQIMNLARVETIDYPQIIPISDAIKPTVDSMDFVTSTGIYFKDKAYIAGKSDSGNLSNDTVLVYNNRVNAWDAPIIGWNPNCFTIYDDGTGEAVYYGDGSTANVYKLFTDDKLDNGNSFTASWRSKLFDFHELGISPADMKEVTNVFVEGYMSENTVLHTSLLLDENGTTQSFSTEILGTATQYFFAADPFNPFGAHPFGYLPFGGSEPSNKRKFRVYLNKDFKTLPLYTLQIDFLSDEENNDWEITAFGFKVRQATQGEKATLYKSFN